MADNPFEDLIKAQRDLEYRLGIIEPKETPGNFTPGSVLFASPAGIITQDNTNLFWNDSTNQLKLGGGNTTSTTALWLDAGYIDTDISTSKVGAVLETTFAPGASQLTTAKFGSIVLALLTGSGGISSAGALVGLRADARYQQSAGTVSGIIYGMDSVVRGSGAGNMGTVYGVRSVPVLSSSGNITTWYGFLAAAPIFTSTGVITTATGLFIQKQKQTGVTTGYGIYQEDVADINLFSGLVTATNSITSTITDAGTTNQVNVLTLGHNSSGTPAAAFGSDVSWLLKSSTTDDTPAAFIRTTWATATHASRAARVRYFVYDTTNRECLRLEASGTAAMIGFLGAGAVVRQTVAAAAPAGGTGTAAGGYDTAAHRDSMITLVNDMRTALINLGLCV